MTAWPRVTALVERAVKVGPLPGALACIGHGDAPPQVIARGTRGRGLPGAPGADTLFRLFSMTKPVTGLLAAMLIDEGRIGLDQPLADILPMFAAPRVAIDPQAGLDSRPARAAITIRHLLTHTSGLGYGGLDDAVSRHLVAAGALPSRFPRRGMPGLAPFPPTLDAEGFLAAAAAAPLMADPGTAWHYAMGLDVLGLAIARVLGQGLDAALRERLFDPLGMVDTGFTARRDDGGRMTDMDFIAVSPPVTIDGAGDSAWHDPPAFPFGGAGLIGTPRDYDRFLNMLAGGGALDGVRVMRPEAVALATSDLLPPGIEPHGLASGYGFGAGGAVGRGARAGEFGWYGASGIRGFVDLRRRLRAVLFSQFMPFEALDLFEAFPQAVRDDWEENSG
ncbi:MAG: beta-lactamase family protein [Sphingomonadales bacterium]|nr:beta-lactamase family protein [Sphingomonadales bacterium]